MHYRDFVILTCEHASEDIPNELRSRFDASNWDRHQIFDFGSLRLASLINSVLKTDLVAGRYSRLVIDLNRSVSNPGVSKLLDSKELDAWIREYYQPFRDQVRYAVETRGNCVHLSIHSFTRVLSGKKRDTDIGVLYDPSSVLEKKFCQQLIPTIRESGFKVHANRPYKGTADGHTTSLRKDFENQPYLGVELEICDELLESKFELVSRLILDALAKHLSPKVFKTV